MFARRRWQSVLPLDVATDTRFLIDCRGASFQNGIERVAQVASVYGPSPAGARIVELTAIDKTALRIKHKKVWRAGGGK